MLLLCVGAIVSREQLYVWGIPVVMHCTNHGVKFAMMNPPTRSDSTRKIGNQCAFQVDTTAPVT